MAFSIILGIVTLLILVAAVYGIISFIGYLLKKTSPAASTQADAAVTGSKSSLEFKHMDISTIQGSLSTRLIIIGLIAMLLLIPISMIGNLVDERHALYRQVLDDIAAQWGQPQTISGPLLVIPFIEKYVTLEKVKNEQGEEKTISKDVYKNKTLVVLPKTLNKHITMGEHYRNRSIYKSLVYEADVALTGSFRLPNLSAMTDNLHKVRYDKAFMVMGLTDTKAINTVSELKFNDNTIAFDPGVRQEIGGLSTGFHAPVSVSETPVDYDFSFSFNTKGSSRVRFTAFGEVTHVQVKSNWQHPSFQGEVLPTSREITENGFVADWTIPSLARNFPQAWINENKAGYDLKTLLTGVDLYEPVFLYSMIERAVKYGILFIALTFLTFLIYELVLESRLHYVQYGLIGLSLAMFYLILLSLSEHVSFIFAYLSAALVTTLSISAYTYFANKKISQSCAIFVLLTALYIILYSILQLEDYALLMGTALLLAVLLVLMWLTRNLRVGAKNS